jgi:hypothetical protein
MLAVGKSFLSCFVNILPFLFSHVFQEAHERIDSGWMSKTVS